MSLSARIVLRPSRRLAVCESLALAGGCAVAAATLVTRWPASDWIVATVAIAGCGLALALRRPASSATLVVSDRAEVGLLATDGSADDTWRLAEATMVWPGWCVVALVSGSRVRRTLAVFDRDLGADERRALHRFLLWSLRGGAGRRPRGA